MTTISSPQPFYYTNSEYQLELNLQAIKQELIIFLDLHTKDCETCKSIKCRCKPNNFKTPEKKSVPKTDKHVGMPDYNIIKDDVSDEFKDEEKSVNGHNNSFQKNKELENNNQDKTDEDKKDTDDKKQDMLEVDDKTPSPAKNTAVALTSSLISPPASYLPKPDWKSKEALGLTPKRPNYTEAWIQSFKFAKEPEHANFHNNRKELWNNKMISYSQAARNAQVNIPVDDFFKNYNQMNLTKMNSQVNKFIPVLKHKMTLASQNSAYNYF